jgi:hypothetical protein
MREGPDSNLYRYARNAPARLTDRLGLWGGVDDAAAITVGALAGLGGQAISDLMAGEMSGWEDYVASGVGGAVGGEMTLLLGPAGYGLGVLAASAVGSAIGGGGTNLIKQGLKYKTGKQCDFSFGSFIWDIAAGGLGGALGSRFKVKNPFAEFPTFDQRIVGETIENLGSAGTGVGTASGFVQTWLGVGPTTP